MKRQTTCLVTLGFLLGLGTVGCTKHNPAFHKPTDGSVSPSPDGMVADTPTTPKDTEPHPDTPIVLKDANIDSKKSVDGEGEVRSDAPGLDGSTEAGGGDTRLAQDGSDAWVPDGKTGPSYEVPPTNGDGERPEVSVLPEDAADAFLMLDGSEGDASYIGDVLPDAEEPDAWPDAEEPELDSQPLTDG